MQFTAAAILLLAQQEKLKLDDSITKYVPEFKLGSNVHDCRAAHANVGPARVHGPFQRSSRSDQDDEARRYPHRRRSAQAGRTAGDRRTRITPSNYLARRARR